MEPREVGELGGVANYVAYMGGEFEPVESVSDEQKEEVTARWKAANPKKEFPYDFDDPRTGLFEYAQACRELGDLIVEEIMAEEEPFGQFDIENVDRTVKAVIDIDGIENRRIRRSLEKLGGILFVHDLWKRAEEITFVAPKKDNEDWFLQIEARGGLGERNKILAMTLSDWEHMLMINDQGSWEELHFPRPDSRSYEGILPLVRSLMKIEVGGVMLPENIKMSERFLH